MQNENQLKLCRVSLCVISVVLTLLVVLMVIAYNGYSSIVPTVQAMGSLAIACSAYVAYRLYRENINRNLKEDRKISSKVFLDESIQLLERAYETFTRNGSHPPKNDRLLWLSTARMIVRFRNMKQNVSEDEHLKILDETEEYIRLKFYSLLDECKDDLTLEYFIPEGNKYDVSTVARKSVAIIFDFAKWRDGKADPLEDINDKELLARGAVPIDFTGVESFIAQYQDYWEEVQNIKAAYEEEDSH